ncbi:TIGR04540 family protein [Clostridium septicum]|uniref:Ribonuclease P n=1 Tax=Clostridium septicum TaxID=1504 RepID=A0A9N7PHR1_CLOSE|nr:TIGR04540 family protein [Clostridium septicum]AYE33026.1 ribonuclease P [Clostridium septicum]MDU1313422.1 TIGR04540 family protein [Clostridium septicum]QAS61195.1 TIGR04540 family protein [Clostridium septicum]UEC19455.1 TIGR04540 family protein [Clostridium septicum]USR99592.1 TIGR04540 family protein [Clostridium septicum]
MRVVYRNPKELATHLKDLVDLYLEDLLSYNELEGKVIKIIKANEDRVYKGNTMPTKLANVLGNERVEIINEIFSKIN